MTNDKHAESRKRALLLVEDEAIIALSETMTLERHGYRVLSASTGERAVELATSDPGIELVLMDINLGPGIDGTQAAEMILAARELPIVFLSSHTEPDVVEKTEKITSYGYIVKNSGETVLTTSVKMAFRLFDSRKLADDTFRHSMNGLCVHRMLYNEAGEPFDCEYLKVNESFELHTGLPAQTVVGRTIRDLYSEEDAREVLGLYAGVVSSGKPIRQELHFAPTDSWFELSVFPTRDREFTVVIQNVTARKHSEQIIAAEKEWLNVTLQSVGDAVIATDVDGGVAVMNAVAQKLTGWDVDEALGRPLSDVFCIVSSLTRGACEDPVERVIREGEVVGLANHTVLVSRDGSEYQIADSAAPIKDANGEIIGVVLVFRDVTEEYRVAQALSDSERDMARAQAMAQLGSWRIELDSGVVTGSDQARRIYGVGEGELTIAQVQSLPLPEYRPALDAALRALVEDEAPYDVEFRIHRQSDDSIRWIHSIAEYDAEHHRIVGTLHDTTRRKQVEEALRESELHFRTLADSGQALVWTSGVDKECNYFNQPWLKFTGRTLDQELGNGWIEGVHPEDRSRCIQIYVDAFGRREPFSMSYRLRRADGEYRWIQDDGTPRHDSHGEFLGYIGHCLDITDLTNAEEATRREHARFAMIAETSPVGITTVDEAGNITYANSAAERTLGLARCEITSRTYDEPAWESTDLDGRPLPDEAQPFHLVKSTGRSVYDVKHAIVRPDGSRVDLSINGSPIFDEDGEFRGMVATIEDITERRQAEELLRDRNATLHEINEYAMELGFLEYDELYPFVVKKLNSVFRTSTAWVTEYDEATSDMVVRATSLSDADNSWVVKQIGKNVVGHRTPVTDEQCKMMRDARVDTPITLHDISFGAIPENLARLIQRGLNVDWFLPVAFMDKGKMAGTAVIAGKPGEEAPDRELLLAFADITGEVIRRKRAEEKLAAKKELLQNITDNMLDLVSLTDTNGNWRFVGNAHRLLGYDISALLGRNVFEFVHSEDSRRIEASFGEWIQSSSVRRTEQYRYRCADGSYAWLETIGTKLFGADNGEMKELLFSSRDITERKRNEERLRKIIDNSPLLIHEVAASGHYLMVNDATCALLGTTREELVGKNLDELLPPDTASAFKEQIDHVVMTREKMTVDDTLNLDGRERIFRSELFPVDRHDGSLPSVIAMAYELTEEIRLSKEKDFLMKELNHRVKNSLNMVSSLVELKDSQSGTDLSDIRHQIKTISLIHEKLYQTERVTEISLKSYVASLLSSIVSFSARHVRIEQDIAEISVPTKQAMSLGLIINEIATNAIKHGFTDTQEPILSVTMEEDWKNSQCQITLSNTGKPFPEEIGLDNPQTLGLQLISALTAQLGGAIELQRTPHPVFTIRFPTGE